MSYRSILVHLDESARCEARVDMAARLAREHGAHLLGLAPTGVINLPARVTPSAAGVPNYLELAQASLNERAAALVHAFNLRVARVGLASVEGRVDEADSVLSLLENARVHDLVVIGQTDRAPTGLIVEQDVPEQVFLRAGTPALVVPFVGDFDSVGGNVVVAWNGSRESSRAVHDAMPLLRKARQVHLMCFERPSDLRHLTRLQLNDAHQWLGRHGVVSHLHQEPVRIDVGEALLSRACDLGADLLVMGGYGHSRVTEFLLGGVTRRLLAQMTLPVLLSH
ncbi:MAG: universal stress protein [Burkholderiales bacterium]